MNATVEPSAAPGTPALTFGRPGWLVLAIAVAVALGIIFYSGLGLMVQWWLGRQEYSYGWFIPPIAAFLVWQKRDLLWHQSFSGSWFGVAVVALGLCVWLLGELSALYTLIQYAFLLTLAGTVLAVTGARAFRTIWVGLGILLLMIPLPNFIYFNLSQQLQLLSSEIGVWVIRLCGISVYLEGNVIDLGDYKLQVVEACSGLRYLFPLMTLGFIVAIFFRAPLWQRALVFLSTLPITVFMNSFRIGMIGVLVNSFGKAQAEGFLHEFEGWVIFMACLGCLLLEILVLLRLSGSRRSLRDAVALELPASLANDRPRQARKIPTQGWVAAGMLAVAVLPALFIPDRIEVAPQRAQFADFPLKLGGWDGRRGQMEGEYVDELKFSDYLLADFVRGSTGPVNLYVAYYDSQRKGASIHSPKACLPGGGWVVESFTQRDVAAAGAARPLRVNRAVITQGTEKQVVYYWFQQRGRIMTNEYVVRWYLFWDALTRNRSDGALVRLIVPVPTGSSEAVAENALQDFARTLTPQLGRYLPD